MKQVPKWLIALLLLITTVSVAISIWVIFFRGVENTNVPLVPDYAPEVEEHAKPIPGDTTEKGDSPQKGGSVTLTYSDQVTVDLSEKTASLIFANPKKSNQDMVLQIVVQDVIVAQSGRLVSGNQISMLSLTDDALAKLNVGGYEGKFVIFFYNQVSGEKATVNTEIPIKISVKK